MVKSNKTIKPSVMSPEEFVLKAMAVNKAGGFKGMNVVYSGFNQAFRNHFGDVADSIEVTTQMRKDGKIGIFLSKGGVALYFREDLKPATLERHDADWKERDKVGYKKKVLSKSPPDSNDESSFLSKILNG